VIFRRVRSLAAVKSGVRRALSDVHARTRTFRTPGVLVAKGYWVSAYRTISDPEKLAAYGKLAGPAVAAGGGRMLARGGQVVAHDDGVAERVVLIEFDSYEQAVAAHASEAYQQALLVLSDAVERDFRIIEGV
jgi:uncharacterized protein (DUF1330 family)